MVKKALSMKYREEREKNAKLGLFMGISYRVGWALWIVGVLLFILLLYFRLR